MFGTQTSFWKPHQASAACEANSRLEIDLFCDLQIDERFGFSNTVHFGKLLGHEIKKVFMILAKYFDHDVVSTTDKDHVDHFVKFGEILGDLHHLAAVGTNADQRHRALAHHQWIGGGNNF